MTQRLIASSALASLMALGLASAVQAADGRMDSATKDKDRCFGIVKAGENDCSSLAGAHSCAGQATADKAPGDWKYVAKGTCRSLGGMTVEEAKAKGGK